MTQVAVADFGKQMQQAEPTFVPRKLIYRMSRADYQKRFGNSYQRPGFFTRVFAFFLKLVPKVGPLKDLALRVPSADAQKTFLSGMDIVVDHYQQSIHTLSAEPADHPSLQLPAVNLDTGKPTSPGSYPLADQTYARYLALLVKPRSCCCRPHHRPLPGPVHSRPRNQPMMPGLRHRRRPYQPLQPNRKPHSRPRAPACNPSIPPSAPTSSTSSPTPSATRTSSISKRTSGSICQNSSRPCASYPPPRPRQVPPSFPSPEGARELLSL